MTARVFSAAILFGIALFTPSWAADDPLPVILTNVEHQPLAAQTERVANALEMLGAPLGKQLSQKLKQAMESKDGDAAIREIQAILDPFR